MVARAPGAPPSPLDGYFAEQAETVARLLRDPPDPVVLAVADRFARMAGGLDWRQMRGSIYTAGEAAAIHARAEAAVEVVRSMEARDG